MRKFAVIGVFILLIIPISTWVISNSTNFMTRVVKNRVIEFGESFGKLEAKDFYSTPNFFNTLREDHSTSKVEIKKIKIGDYGPSKSHVNFIKIKKGSAKFKVTNKNHESHDIWINANYFMKDGTPIGEVKINGKNITKKRLSGSYFTSDGNEPRLYFGKRPDNVLYSAQTHTPIMLNGSPYSKIFNQSWAKRKLPRLIVGKDSNGDFCVVHTIGLTACSVKEFYEIAKDLGIINAMMFDGGASIEVGVRDGIRTFEYQIIGDSGRKIGNVPTPTVFIVGDFI